MFHSPQPGQRPCHFGLSCPHAVQAKTVAERAIPTRLSAELDGLAPSVRSARFDHLFVSKLDQPLAPAEFVALDTETNGYGGDLCEMTEVGAVLVGGGELHETFDSLVQVERPLSRGIQRFTGITQGMVDGAPPPEEVLAELADLLEGRVLIAHNARFDVARAAPGLRARRAGLAEARRCSAPSSSRAASRPWPASGRSRRSPARSESRSTRCTARCPTPSRARACSARCSRSCARTP